MPVEDTLEVTVGDLFYLPLPKGPIPKEIRLSLITVATVDGVEEPEGDALESVKLFPNAGWKYEGTLFKATKPGTETVTSYGTTSTGEETKTRYRIIVKAR